MNEPPDLPVNDIIGVAICIVFSAFFSGTETALTALSQSRSQQLIDEGGRFSRVLRTWVDHPNRTLTTLLVGNNIVNILASVLAYRIADLYLDSFVDAAAVAAMTMLLLVFGEVTPKTFAKHNPDKVGIPAMHLVRLFMVLVFPLAWVLARFSSMLVRFFGGNTSADGPPVTEGEIEYMIELGQREDVFEESGRGELLTSALEFSEIIAKEVMIPRTEAHFLRSKMSITEALEQTTRWGHSRIPVYGESVDHVDGILYAKDLLQEATVSGTGTLASIIRRNFLHVPETQHISETLRNMQSHRLHMGIVVDEFGGTAGLITIEDILEELVGEIRDEYDREDEPLRKIDEDTYLVDAGYSVFDMGKDLGVEIPDDGEYESVGGFVTSRLGRVPEVGAEVTFGGLKMTVRMGNERRAQQITVQVVDVTEDPDSGSDSGRHSQAD